MPPVRGTYTAVYPVLGLLLDDGDEPSTVVATIAERALNVAISPRCRFRKANWIRASYRFAGRDQRRKVGEVVKTP